MADATTLNSGFGSPAARTVGGVPVFSHALMDEDVRDRDSRVPTLAARSRGDPDYLVQTHLAQTLARAIGRALGGQRDLVVVDVGAGGSPYQSLLAPFTRRHVSIDFRKRPGIDVAGVAEQLPLRAGCADVVLATQVLEHVEDPARAVSEWQRVLRPGGRVFASTHGSFFYHPDPVDYWRWTSAGLEKLFRAQGLAVRSVESCEGTRTTFVSLLAYWMGTRSYMFPAWLGSAIRLFLLLPLNLASDVTEVAWRTYPRSKPIASLSVNYVVVAQKG
jgi:SAM-dependent methyltransferase